MKDAFGLSVPEGLKEVCDPSRCALILYDMQNGIVPQIAEGQAVLKRCEQLLSAARTAGFRIFFTRHLFLPNRATGVGQLRRAMVWQRQSDPAKTRPFITQGSPAWQIVPELAPQEDEVVIDKITMSAFEGTPLSITLRDCGVTAVAFVGIALEIGIEPSARHAADLGFTPIIVSDACGFGSEEAAARSLEALRFSGDTVLVDEAAFIAALA